MNRSVKPHAFSLPYEIDTMSAKDCARWMDDRELTYDDPEEIPDKHVTRLMRNFVRGYCGIADILEEAEYTHTMEAKAYRAMAFTLSLIDAVRSGEFSAQEVAEGLQSLVEDDLRKILGRPAPVVADDKPAKQTGRYAVVVEAQRRHTAEMEADDAVDAIDKALASSPLGVYTYPVRAVVSGPGGIEVFTRSDGRWRRSRGIPAVVLVRVEDGEVKKAYCPKGVEVEVRSYGDVDPGSLYARKDSDGGLCKVDLLGGPNNLREWPEILCPTCGKGISGGTVVEDGDVCPFCEQAK